MRTRFVEDAQPNWWQVPPSVWEKLFGTEAGQTFLKSLESTTPFANAIGKWVHIVEKDHSIDFNTARDLAKAILRSYLFAAATPRWKPHTFDLVWAQCLDYFDSAKDQLSYVLYAPLWGFSGVQRSLSLGDGLEIRRLPNTRLAEIASLNDRLAGVTTGNRLTLWPSYFFVKQFSFRKHVGTKEDYFVGAMQSTMGRAAAWLNEEVVLLRALLSDEVSVSSYAIVREDYPRDPGGLSNTLPWRPRRPFVERSPSSQEVTRYAKKRVRFKSLSDKSGWAAVAASMRRFAIAWENPFPADSLADIIAALEGLLVREHDEVSYKLRVRAAYMLARNPDERRTILKDIRDGYVYRSRVAHGDYVFDDAGEWNTAKALKRAKGKHGNPFHDVNEVHRLKFTLAGYYKSALSKLIRIGQLEIDWTKYGL